MATIHVSLEGTDELERKLKKLSKAAATTIAKDAVDEGAINILKSTKNNIHTIFSNKQTGALANSFSIENYNAKGRISAVISTHKIYAPVYEFGSKTRNSHRIIEPRPFLKPAVEENKDELKEKLSDEINKWIKKG